MLTQRITSSLKKILASAEFGITEQHKTKGTLHRN
jgi:hypothetical protein